MAQVIAWLDSSRWSPENQSSLLWEPAGLSSASQEILVHWLTYITDMQRPWQYVWRVGRKVFIPITRSFPTHNFHTYEDVMHTQHEVIDFLDNFRGEKKPHKVRPFLYEEMKYRPRFPNQHRFIERTLTILTHSFDRNFVKFIGESIKKWSGDSYGLQRVARDLYFLTYSNYPLEKTLELFDDDPQSNQPLKYTKWVPYGYKRLWAALRDYRKARSYLSLLHRGLKEAMGRDLGEQLFKAWTTTEEFGLHRLELPGDVRNIAFLKRLVIPLVERCGINIKKSWKASRIARETYNVIGDKNFYPEQLDVSWDLSDKACDNGLCDLCPFSTYDLEKICLSDMPKVTGKKYCPIVLAICQYRSICNPKNCPIVEKIGRGLCQGAPT